MNSLRTGPGAPALYCEIEGLEVDVEAASVSRNGCFVKSIEVHLRSQNEALELFLRSPAGTATIDSRVVAIVSLETAQRDGRTPGYELRFLDLDAEARRFIDQTVLVIAQAAPPAASEPPAERPRIKSQTQKARRKPVSAEGPAKDAAKARAELRASVERESQWAAWRLLGIEAKASIDKARAAFLELAKRVHPHAYARYRCPEVSELATRRFILYQQALEEFCRDAARRAPGGAPAGRGKRRARSTHPYQQDKPG